MLEIVAHEKNIGENLVQTIAGRDIHTALELGRDYSSWAKAQIESLQLIENVDFVCSPEMGSKSRGGHNRTEYYFTIDIAKHIALASRTEKGRVYRQALIDLENRVSKQATQLPSAEEKAHSILRIFEHADRLGLTDGYTRILAMELTHNLMKEAQAPGQLITAEKSATDNYFMIEDLRDLLQMSKQRWFSLRSIFGKIARTAIQAADENVKPLKVKKFVNGNEHEVNAWPIEYRDIAIAAIERYIGRQRD